MMRLNLRKSIKAPRRRFTQIPSDRAADRSIERPTNQLNWFVAECRNHFRALGATGLRRD